MGLLGSIAGGLLGVGSSSIQNSQNRQNVKETNQMNYKINQMNNQFNERMAMQQRSWQENMWNKENAYNTASAQRQRLEEAGLNPYLMMNGGSAGVAQSAGTGTSASSSGNAVMQPFQADYSGIGSSIGNIFQYELMQSEKSQLQGAKQLADAKAMETLSNIDWGKLTDETRSYLKSTGLARAQLGYAKEQQEADNMAMTGLIMRAQRSGMLLDNKAKGILNKYLDQQQQLDLNVKAADYYQRMSSGYLSYAAAKKAIAEEALAAALVLLSLKLLLILRLINLLPLIIMRNSDLVFLKIMLAVRMLKNGIVLEMKRKNINILILINGLVMALRLVIL